MKNLTFLCTAMLCLSICFSSCGNDANMPELTLYPGQGINNLKIGDPGSKVKSELGDGFEIIINEGFSGNATYNYFNDPRGVDVVFGQQSSDDLDINALPIKAFYLYQEFDGMTVEGIKIGSTKAEVVSTYGEPDEIDDWANVYYIGLIISYDDLDKVQSISILEI